MTRVDDYLRQIQTAKRQSSPGSWYQIAELALEAAIEDNYAVKYCIREVISSRVALAGDLSGLRDAVERTLTWIDELDLERLRGPQRSDASVLCRDLQERLGLILEYLQGQGLMTTAEVAGNLRRSFSCSALALEMVDQKIVDQPSGKDNVLRTVKAAALTDLERFPEARDVIESVLNDNPQDPYAENQRIRVLRLMDSEEARTSAQENFQRQRNVASALALLPFRGVPEGLRSEAEEIVARSRQHCRHWAELVDIEEAFYLMLEQPERGTAHELADKARHRSQSPCQHCRDKARELNRHIQLYLKWGSMPPGY